MNKKIEAAFNAHLNAEFYSSYLYLSMANYFAHANLPGMAAWMRVQAGEEDMHAKKFIDFIIDRDGRVVLEQIDKPKTDWSGPLEAFQNAYDHECLISGKINELVDLSLAETDHMANSFLQWFVSEQVEEEATVQGIVEKLKMIGDNSMGILMIDEQLGQRTPTAAPTAP